MLRDPICWCMRGVGWAEDDVDEEVAPPALLARERVVSKGDREAGVAGPLASRLMHRRSALGRVWAWGAMLR